MRLFVCGGGGEIWQESSSRGRDAGCEGSGWCEIFLPSRIEDAAKGWRNPALIEELGSRMQGSMKQIPKKSDLADLFGLGDTGWIRKPTVIMTDGPVCGIC